MSGEGKKRAMARVAKRADRISPWCFRRQRSSERGRGQPTSEHELDRRSIKAAAGQYDLAAVRRLSIAEKGASRSSPSGSEREKLC